MPIADKAPSSARLGHQLREFTSVQGLLNRQREGAVVHALPSTVSIVTQQEPNIFQRETEIKDVEMGSGFVVRSRPTRGNIPGEVLIATNRHVVEDVFHDKTGTRSLRIETSGAEGDTRRSELKKHFFDAEIVYVSEKHDLAFVRLPLTEHPEVKMPALELGYSSLVKVSDTLISIGAPLGIEDTVTEINVSQTGLIQINDEMGSDLYRQITTINPGNSGGAVIDPLYPGKPRVVGMPTVGIKDNPTIGYMLPAEVIRDELTKFEQQEAQKARTRRTNRIAA